jgi:ATP-dependent DNA ligase
MQLSFDNAVTGIRMSGASTSIRDLVSELEQHGSQEGELLAVYEDLAENSTDQGARYLISLILEDERRHHRLLVEMANALAWGDPSASPDPATPAISSRVDGELLALTTKLRRAEEADYRKLRRMKRRLRPFAKTTMWSLIVDLMVLDTKKHATILRFLERRNCRH